MTNLLGFLNLRRLRRQRAWLRLVRRNIRLHFRYGSYVFRHKWYVFQECLKLKVPIWIAVLHDWDKFLPGMWYTYAVTFYGPWPYKNRPPWLKEAFDRAWNGHAKRNKHHWQYWLFAQDRPDNGWRIQAMQPELGPFTLAQHNEHMADVRSVSGDTWDAIRAWDVAMEMQRNLNAVRPLEIPDLWQREMLADWRGANRAVNGKDETWEWYRQSREFMLIHPETAGWLEKQLDPNYFWNSLTRHDYRR